MPFHWNRFAPYSDEDLRDSMIVVGYTILYDSSWQNIPYLLEQNMKAEFIRNMPFPYDVPLQQAIQARWQTLEEEQGPIYTYWTEMMKDDERVKDFCWAMGMVC